MKEQTLQTIKWDASEFLKTEEDIAAYLALAFEEGDPEMIALAIGHVAKARGMTEIAKKAGVSREQLYRSFRKGGDPKLTTLVGVMNSLGMELTAQLRKPARKTAGAADRPMRRKAVSRIA